MAQSPYIPTSSYFGYQQPKPRGMTGAQAIAASVGTTRPGPPRLGIDAFPGKAADMNYGLPPGLGGGYGGGGLGTTRRMVQPDYSGILAGYSQDARARFGAGLAAMKAQRLSQARAAINRLGIRNPNARGGEFAKYGLTQADLQGAADNPWSELKALDYQNRRQWVNDVSALASRGGFRSGASVNKKTMLENERTRNEAQMTQDVLSQLSEGLFGESEWERQGRDTMEQNIAQQQAALAAAYQPYWVEE